MDLYFSYAGLRGSPTHDQWTFLFLTEVRLAWQLQNLERTLFMSCLGLWQRVGMGRGARAGEQPQRFLRCHRPKVLSQGTLSRWPAATLFLCRMEVLLQPSWARPSLWGFLDPRGRAGSLNPVLLTRPACTSLLNHLLHWLKSAFS